MDGHRFDALTRSLARTTSSRRLLLTGAAATALGSLAATLGLRPAEATHYDCRDVGARCRRGRQCCSGKCKNKKCQAHHAGNCVAGGTPDATFCRVTAVGSCGTGCSCFNTTGGAGFCGTGVECFANPPCTKDKECVQLTGNPAAACVVCPFCGSPDATACATPCPSVAR